jgi:hypothetical protein
MEPRPAALIGFGALAGLAWSAALRGYMVELAGPASRIDWVGTFAQILLPGVVVGALLGWAEVLRRTGGRPGWRWLAAAPVLFAIAPQFTPGAFVTFVTTGLGGGSIAVALIGVLGGFAISGRGPLWARIVTGLFALALVLGGAVAAFGVPLPFGPLEPRGAWIGVLFASLMVLLALACSIPHRRALSPAASSSANSSA